MVPITPAFINNITVDRIVNPEPGLYPPILAYLMNGAPLTREHGFPVRLMVHEMFGFCNVKWIARTAAKFSNTDTGTYQTNGFSLKQMKVTSRSTTLHEGSQIPPGPTEIAAFAVSGHEAIQLVEVSIDGGAFQPATLVPFEELTQKETFPPNIRQLADKLTYPYRAVWSKWVFQWNAPTGARTPLGSKPPTRSETCSRMLTRTSPMGRTGLPHTT